jgi:hypothetical protein
VAAGTQIKGESSVKPLAGIVVAHLYYFVIVELRSNPDTPHRFVETPQLLRYAMGERR